MNATNGIRHQERVEARHGALDTAKMSWPDVDQLWYRIFAEKMYDVAEKLAGDRKDEALYGAVRGVGI